MFSKLFKSKIEHKDPQVRKAAVKTLSNTDELCRIALKDEDQDVRQQALNQLQTSFSDKDKLDSATAASLFNVATDSSFKQRLIPFITDNNQIFGLIESLEDEAILILLALASATPVARKAASEKVSGLDALKQLQQQSSDKNVLQIVRQKIQTIKAEEKQKQQAHDSLEQICEALERLAKLDYESQTASRVHLLETRWQQVDDQYKANFKDRYQLAVQMFQLKANAAKQQAALEELHIAQNQLCQSICDTFEREITKLDINTKKLWKNKFENISGQWQQVCKDFTPEIQTNERFYNLSNAAEKLTSVVEQLQQIETKQTPQEDVDAFESLSALEQTHFDLVKNLNWPFVINAPKLYTDLKQQHSQLKIQLKAEQKKHQEKRQQIDKKVTILKSHIRQKNLIKANRLFNYIHNIVAEFPPSLRESEEKKLELVTQSLNELRGLNKFVTAPKKESLCEQMEALINNKQKPEELMQQIKAIQEKWKSLATSDAEADDILWERFKLAADKAYEPYQVYLKELEALKKKNLDLRKKLSVEVEAELAGVDWQHVDWKKIQSEFNQNWKKWNTLSPVFFSENKPVQQHFESLMSQFKEKLNKEKNENHLLYDQLIERAVALVDGLEDDNVDEGIEQIKRLQSSWKNVGITHFNKSNKQWHKFRKLCDKVFEFKRNKHKTLLAQHDRQADSAFKIIDQIKALKRLPDEQLPASQSDYQDLKQQFEEIVDLPENRREKIEKRFKQVCDEYVSHLSGLPARARVSSHNQTRKAAKLCAEAENLTFEKPEQQRFDAIKAEFESLENIPGKTLTTLRARVEQAQSVISGESEYDAEQMNDNEKQLSQLAIELEVMFDLESPDAAKPQRMSYQLEQLQAGIKLSSDKQEKLDQLVEIENQWYNIGAVRPNARKQLEERLQAIIKQAET